MNRRNFLKSLGFGIVALSLPSFDVISKEQRKNFDFYAQYSAEKLYRIIYKKVAKDLKEVKCRNSERMWYNVAWWGSRNDDDYIEKYIDPAIDKLSKVFNSNYRKAWFFNFDTEYSKSSLCETGFGKYKGVIVRLGSSYDIHFDKFVTRIDTMGVGIPK